MPKAQKPTIDKRPTRAPAAKAAGWRQLIASSRFAWCYAFFAILVLAGTTILWAVLGAHLQSGNADQSANAFLFEHASTFHNASLPGQHTFLLKLPLFLLIRLFGYSSQTFAAFTVVSVLVTIAGLVALLYKIERRPLAFGTLCLGLASVLLLVPAMPYAGGILPVNMAMLTTRNLEYLVYIAGLILLVRNQKILSWRFGLGVTLLALLIASDKLFLTLSLGGALLALVVYALAKGWNLVSLSVKWVMASLLATAGAAIALGLLNRTTHVVAQASTPYNFVHTAHALAIGGLFAVAGLFTNLGANPAFDSQNVRAIPHQALHRLHGLSGISFVINILIMLAALMAMGQILKKSFAHNKSGLVAHHDSAKLALLLVFTSMAALIAFMATDHNYPVDARYLTITLFAAFIALAVASSARKSWQPQQLVAVGFIISIGLAFGLTTFVRTYRVQSAALTANNDRNDTITQVMAQHKVDVLVGDYWRVVPMKLAAKGNLAVMPLQNCTQARSLLSSTEWQPDLATHSFAYLLSFDRSLTDYPTCTLDQIISAYGRPNKSVLIAGSLSQPKEQLLFYDKGAQKSAPAVILKKPSTVLPISLDELPNTNCDGPVDMNIVAHQDDDLLFMNPDIQHSLRAGHCIRTVYITAGDAGEGQFYWLSRERGSEAAYDLMNSTKTDAWIERIVKLADNEFMTVANPRANSKLSLIFMHLPDGNVDGNGFKASHNQSLQKLAASNINSVDSVDGQSTYKQSQLVDALSRLMHVYHPTNIRTQANYVSKVFADHSDHMAVSQLVKSAYSQYEKQYFENNLTIPLSFYIGYPIHGLPINLSGEDFTQKEAVFFAYGESDNRVCRTLLECSKESAYGTYLSRQYKYQF